MRRPTIFESIANQPTLTGGKVRLRPRRVEDASDYYRWRTDAKLCQLDATTPIEYSFSEFLERYSTEIEYPGMSYNYAIETLDGRHIGECGLFHIDLLSSNAEIGILIGEREYWDRGYGYDCMQTFLHHIFQSYDLNMIILRTLDWNIRAQSCFKKCGFEICGELLKGDYTFIIMRITRERFLHSHQ